MNAEIRPFRRRRLSPDEGKAAAQRVLELPLKERRTRAKELLLNDPETLLPLFDNLRTRLEVEPNVVYEEIKVLYDFLQSEKPQYPLDAFLLDEREYFLGEAARIAGTASRNLSLREDARRWLDIAEGWFLLTENAAGNIAKVTYQRLAIRVEERDFAPVMELLPQLQGGFEKLGMHEDYLKARFLEANILRETDRQPQAIEIFNEVVLEAVSLRNDFLLSHAYVNLVQLNALLGQATEATSIAAKAAPILRGLGNRIGLAKLYWGLGYLHQSQSNSSGAIEAFRSSQREFAEIGMRADVAAVQLLIADLLLDAGHDKQAEWEIRQALPIIDEYKLVPEGFAALTLLRESLRRQKIDRQALRSLHGYFEELSA
jgi:tetratricopeptide (TPR) repeat protein